MEGVQRLVRGEVNVDALAALEEQSEVGAAGELDGAAELDPLVDVGHDLHVGQEFGIAEVREEALGVVGEDSRDDGFRSLLSCPLGGFQAGLQLKPIADGKRQKCAAE